MMLLLASFCRFSADAEPPVLVLEMVRVLAPESAMPSRVTLSAPLKRIKGALSKPLMMRLPEGWMVTV